MKKLLAFFLFFISCFHPTITTPKENSVVKITIKTDAQDYSCNGFVIDARGAILTAAHCIQDAFWFGLIDGREVRRYDIETIDMRADIAIIAPYREIHRSPEYDLPKSAPAIGEPVYFFDKYGERRDSMIKGYQCVTTDLGARLCLWVLEVAPMKGNSGSPVFHARGGLIGVIVAGEHTKSLTYFSTSYPSRSRASSLANSADK